MIKTNYADDKIGQPQLRKVIEALIDQIQSEHPQLKLDPNQRKALVDNMLKVLANDPNAKFERNRIMGDDMAKRMALCIMAAITLSNDNHLQEALQLIFSKKNLTLTPELLLKMKKEGFRKFMEDNFTKDELKKIHELLLQSTDTLYKNMSKQFNLRPAPGAPKEAADDLYMNLFGLPNSAVAGSIAVPIFCYIGNGLGFNDWNPYDGSAPIDQVNSLKDMAFGDSLGLNAVTFNHFLSLGYDAVETVYQNALYESGQNVGPVRPQLTQQD